MKVFQHLSLMFTHQVRIDLSLWFKRLVSAVAAKGEISHSHIRCAESCRVLRTAS